MKRIAVLISIVSLFIITTPSYAQSICPKGGQFSSLCNLDPSKAGGIVGAVVQVLLIIAIISSLFFLVWGGVRWIISGGDKGQIAQARATIIAAIVGLIIALLSFFILDIILTFVTGRGLSTMMIPTLLQ